MKIGRESLGRHGEHTDGLPDPILGTQHKLVNFLVMLRKDKLPGFGREERNGDDWAACSLAVCHSNGHGASSQVWDRLGGNKDQLKEQGTAAGSCQAAGLVTLILTDVCQIHGDNC